MGPLGLASAVLLGAALTYQVDGRTEARARPGDPSIDDGPVGVDLELDPGASISWHLPRGSLEARYQAGLILLNPVDPLPQMSQYGRVRGELRFTPEVTGSVQEEARYGFYEFGSLLRPVASETPVVERTPAQLFVHYLYSDAEARLAAQLSPRLSVDGSGGYIASGGADTEARLDLPLSQGPVGRARVTWALTRTTRIESAVEASDTSFTGGRQIALAIWTEKWAIRPASLWDVYAAAGVGGSKTNDPGAPGPGIAMPVGRAGVLFGRPPPAGPQGGFAVDYEPFLDRVAAMVYPRLDAQLWGGWGFSEELWLVGRLGAAKGWAPVSWVSQPVVVADASAAYRVHPQWNLQLGVRGISSPFFYGIAYVGCAFVQKGEL